MWAITFAKMVMTMKKSYNDKMPFVHIGEPLHSKWRHLA